MEKDLPVINLELSSGEFRINTHDAVYNIKVNPDNSLTRVVEKVVEKEVPAQPAYAPAPAGGQPVDEGFFRELTEEMYGEIGKLARQLSLSIKEIPGPNFKGVDIEQTGIELESAKDQLEDIVQMTEKATMDIMDLAESIQDDLQGVEKSLGSLKDLDFMATAAPADLDWGADLETETAEPAPSGGEEPHKLLESTSQALSGLLEQSAKLREAIAGLPELSDELAAEAPAPAPQPEPETQKVASYVFDLDVVFQTLYELCTNEAVKDHIKAMRTDQGTAFNADSVLAALNDLAPTVEVEDNFYNFPINNILKSLFSATNNEKYKQILKKMNQTSASIFLDSILPIEGEMVEKEVTVQPAAPPEAPAAQPSQPSRPGLPPQLIQELLGLADENLSGLNQAKDDLEAAASEISAGGGLQPNLGPDFDPVKKEDRDLIVQSVENVNEMVGRIMSHVTRILEALSFQDLSGQRIFKIVRLISSTQVQLLTLLISFGSRLKVQSEAAAEDGPKDTQKMAQEEIDKMLERVSPPSELHGPEAEGRLDQGAVNNLLAELGF